MTHIVHHGDCREVMATLDAASVDAVVCDPPYGLSFMGKGWDHGVPGEEFWTEAMRVAKPGAHLLAFGGTRTYHRLACAIEDAGWEIRDCVMWVYGSGFPKSHDVSKAIDKAAGAEREKRWKAVTANSSVGTLEPRPWLDEARKNGGCFVDGDAPATDAARQWSGWGTALKPAWEPIIVARKPLCGTVAENVLTHGTGGINVDGCRVGTDDNLNGGTYSGELRRPGEQRCLDNQNRRRGIGEYVQPSGRWPANVIHDGSDEVVGLFPQCKSGVLRAGTKRTQGGGYHGGFPEIATHYDTGGDSGSAARFFYCAKASKADRDEGCEGIDERLTMRYGEKAQEPLPQQTPSKPVAQRNHHPTVKPTALMRYLCRLITPPGGVVLDPFTGSGSTGKAAVLEGFDFVGIEREAEYVEIARSRIAAAVPEMEPAA